MKTLYIFTVISALVVVCSASFYIATAPHKMEFLTESESSTVIKRRDLPSVITFLMGMPSKYLQWTESWEGVKNIDVFHPPKANLFVTIHLPSEILFSLSKYIRKYETDNHDLSVPPIFELNSAIISQYEDRSLVKALVLEDQYKYDAFHDTKIDLRRIKKQLNDDQSVLLTLPPDSLSDLNSDHDADVLFLGEMQMMKNFLDDLNNEKAVHRTSSYHVMLSSVDRLSETYGAGSKQVKEAVAVLEYFIPHFIEATNAHFHGQLLSEVEINGDKPAISDYMVRHTRSLMQAAVAADVPNSTLLNLAEPNSDEFGVIFNIVLWFMIGFTLVAVAATYVLWFMDPGKDNIIYRATSQRMKIN